MKIRVGFGFDVHRLVQGRDLWLGGIKIPYDAGLLGHSDADVLLHAVCDALLGAANMRDIGYHFPDTGAAYKDIDSKILLQKTMQLLADNAWRKRRCYGVCRAAKTQSSHRKNEGGHSSAFKHIGRRYLHQGYYN